MSKGPGSLGTASAPSALGRGLKRIANALNLVAQARTRYARSATFAERSLRKRLAAVPLTVKLTDSCVRDFALEVRAQVLAGDPALEYQDRLAQLIETCNAFLRDWTGTRRAGLETEYPPAFISLARKHALPRAWPVSIPTAHEARSPQSLYWRWARLS